MRRFVWVLFLLACANPAQHERGDAAASHKEAGGMNISSPAFGDGTSIPSKYTCDGANTSPPLAFSGVPAKAQSLVLIVDDPDAPGGTFDHWIAWNIPPNTTSVGEGQSPQGSSGRNGFGKTGYGGPCPPSGEHRYQFKLYALDTTLTVAPSATKANIENLMRGHTVAEAQMVGKYKRG
jgi:Raf kinase inhibitor-like YbhB/YbcL family protein